MILTFIENGQFCRGAPIENGDSIMPSYTIGECVDLTEGGKKLGGNRGILHQLYHCVMTLQKDFIAREQRSLIGNHHVRYQLIRQFNLCGNYILNFDP